jgi:lipopolysaccharide/colanic/teichoic acid biosynthesis glycosyltransferase
MQRPPDIPHAWPLAEAFRRLLDIAVAGVALLLLAPLMLVVAWRIRRDSPGPAIFRQTRAGRDMRPFALLKFRTMRTDADPYGHSPHGPDDPRLTPFGRRLREWSFDELPQFWNVLRGDMTLVGPRPLYVEQAREWNDRQRLRLRVKPGLTGLAQISGRGGLTIEEKLELDVQYVLHRSLLGDMGILIRTIFGLRRSGEIYEKRYSETEEFRSRS